MEIVPLLVLMAVFAVASGAVARRKRRRVWLWALLGALFTIAALIIVAILPGRRGRAASGGVRADGLDDDSRLRARTEAEAMRRKQDDARAEAHRDMSSHIPGGGF
ncbi:MAG: hypothetical protein F4X25_10590 [Chloroflexi bacterium]|nr:hypothetical protein [Chloroflexota bacterium]